MKRFLKIVMLSGVFFLSACAPMSVQGIREAGNIESFTVAENYQAAYRLLVEEMRRCMQYGMITASVVVHGEVYTDIKKAVITPTMHGGFGAMPLFVVDIVEVNAGSARVDVITKSAGTADARLLKGVFEKTPLCQP